MKLRNDSIVINNNSKINYIIKDNTIYLSKKEIIKLFGINKKDLNIILDSIKENNSEFYYSNTSKLLNKKLNKSKKYFSLNILISVGYRVKIYSGVKLLININRNINNISNIRQNYLTEFKNKVITSFLNKKISF